MSVDPRMSRRGLSRGEHYLTPAEADAQFRMAHGTFAKAVRYGLMPALIKPPTRPGSKPARLIHPDDACQYAGGKTWEAVA